VDLIKIRAFYIIAQSGSFSKAAEELYLTQPAISAQIKDLEKIYGVKLFERIGHRVELTEEGKALLPYAERIVSSLDESRVVVQKTANSKIKYLRVGASLLPGMYLLPEIVAGYKERYPDVSISVRVGYATQISKMVRDSEMDVGIVGGYGVRGCIKRGNNLREEVICHDRMVLVVGSKHPLREFGVVNLKDLKGEGFVLSPESALTRRFIRDQFRKFNIPLRVRYEFGNIEIIKRFVEKNLGVSILPYSTVKKEEKDGRLHCLEISDLNLDRSILIVYQKRRLSSNILKNFLDFVRSLNLQELI